VINRPGEAFAALLILMKAADLPIILPGRNYSKDLL